MIDPSNLLQFALEVVSGRIATTGEAWDRRAISASYYALFHHLCRASARSFAQAGPDTEAQATRGYSHTEMRQVCSKVLKPSGPLMSLLPSTPDLRLRLVANNFIKLQLERHRADYDVNGTVTRQDALNSFTLSQQAFRAFDEIEHDRPTAVFLAALVFADRWNK